MRKIILGTDIDSDIDDALCLVCLLKQSLCVLAAAALFEGNLCSYKRGRAIVRTGSDWGITDFRGDSDRVS